MTQYDAGPGDWSDREWDAPDWESQPQAKRRRVVLPPWALLAILVATVILLCVGLILIVKAIRGGGQEETPTPATTAALQIVPVETEPSAPPMEALTQTMATAVPPTEMAAETPRVAEITTGAIVLVKGTGGGGLNLRAKPTAQSNRIGRVQDGTELTVLEGPVEAEGHVWWKLRTPKGKEGWGAQEWLALKTE